MDDAATQPRPHDAVVELAADSSLRRAAVELPASASIASSRLAVIMADAALEAFFWCAMIESEEVRFSDAGSSLAS